MKTVEFVFTIIGACCFALVTGLFIANAMDAIRRMVSIKKREYKIKHQLDKLPTAKCYCKDCVWRDEDNDCGKFFGWRPADDCFCWMAEPREQLKEE